MWVNQEFTAFLDKIWLQFDFRSKIYIKRPQILEEKIAFLNSTPSQVHDKSLKIFLPNMCIIDGYLQSYQKW